MDYTVQAPIGSFPYEIRTTGMLEHSSGIAWTAELFREGVKIGTVEQEGHGGADRVFISDLNQMGIWRMYVDAAFAKNEEAATFWLMCKEDGDV